MIRVLISFKFSVALFATLSLVGSAWSQNAGFSGMILDASGGSIAGAQIVLTNEATGALRETVSGDDGKYVFTQLPPGKYRAEVKAPGFKVSVRQHLELLIRTTSTSDIKLEVGAVSEMTLVEARLAPLNTTDASIGRPISGSELDSLPILDMNPAGLQSLQAGVPFIPSKPDNPSGERDQSPRWKTLPASSPGFFCFLQGLSNAFALNLCPVESMQISKGLNRRTSIDTSGLFDLQDRTN